MAMAKLADEMSAISGMKAVGATGRTEKNLRAAATATALSEPTPRALMATAPGGGSAGSADITVFVRVREDKSELVSRTAITVPRGSTPTDVARTAVKSKFNDQP